MSREQRRRKLQKAKACLECGDPREIVARGLCSKCYDAEENARNLELAMADRHNPAIRHEHQKLIRAFAQVMVGLGQLGVSKHDALTIRAIIEPYLEPIAKFLSVPTEPDNNTTTVNGESVAISVHRSQQAEKE